MLFGENLRKIIVGTAVLLSLVLLGSYFINGLRPAASPKTSGEKTFEVKTGEGFLGIVKRLGEERLIRRPIVFKAVSLIIGAASRFKPGTYKLSPTMNSLEVLNILLRGPEREVTVLIPEGSSLYEIDAILAAQGVFPKKSFIRFSASSSQPIEGRLFPDTYRFFVGASPESVSEKFLENFEAKAAPFLNRDQKHFDSNLILASLLQKEVPEPEDQRIVAGILKKLGAQTGRSALPPLTTRVQPVAMTPTVTPKLRRRQFSNSATALRRRG